MSKQKKIIAFILMNAVLLNFMPIGAKAQSAAFDQNAYNLEPETTFTVSISGQNLESVDSVDLTLEYDSSLVQVLDVVGGDFTDPESFFGVFWGFMSMGEKEQIMISIPCDFAYIGNGELVSVVFKTKTNTGSTNIDMIDMTYYKNLFEEYPGNTGDSVVVNVSVPDTMNPQIEINTPSVDSTYDYSSVNNTLTIGGTASDNVTVASVSYTVNNGSSILANGTDVWSAEIALAPGENTITVTATDTSGLTASDTITVNYTVVVLDTTAPVRSAGSPSGELASETNEVVLSLNTDEAAVCRYNDSANTGYNTGNPFTNSGTTYHSTMISGLTSGTSYNFYVRCMDNSGNINGNDYIISFSIKTTSTIDGNTNPRPSKNKISGLAVSDFKAVKIEGTAYVTWKNPTSENFSNVDLVRSTVRLANGTSLESAKQSAVHVYSGSGQEFTDTSISPSIKYYYYIYTTDKSGVSGAYQLATLSEPKGSRPSKK
jgi:hypothetical protein